MFRRSGSVACYHVEDSLPAALGEEFCEALRQQRFRTIEDAASEQTSIGWVTSADPSGNTFEREHMDADQAVWLRLRIDKKSAPTKWLQIHRIAAEASEGRKLTARERRELKEDLLSKLLPRVLPSVALIDALYFPKRQLVMLFGTSNSVREAFLSLFYKTFGARLSAADPHRLALATGLDRQRIDALREITPVRWPDAQRGASGQPAPSGQTAPRTQEVGA